MIAGSRPVKRLLFHGSIEAEKDAERAHELVSEIAKRTVADGRCLLVTGPGPLDRAIANALNDACEDGGTTPTQHLEWVVTDEDSLGDHIELRIGRRTLLDLGRTYRSYARLRTYLVRRADAVITIGGSKGVVDVVEKARLAGKPYFTIATVGGESREMWRTTTPEDLWFCTSEEFNDLADLNLSARELVARLFDCLSALWLPPLPRVFIVHGHDGSLKYELKDFLQNDLGLQEPVVLQDQPSRGRTVIEKLEDYAGETNIAFVLLTPDDHLATPDDSNDRRWQARQNAILELGYFLGKWTRRSGHVIVLHRGGIEIPSDVAGLTYISVEAGIRAAGEEIRRELDAWQ